MKKLNKKSVSGLELVSKEHFMHSFSHENCPYYVMLNAIWCHLYNLKNMEKFLGSALLLVKLQAPNHTKFLRGALRDLVQFVQFSKLEKRPWRSVTFSKVAD